MTDLLYVFAIILMLPFNLKRIIDKNERARLRERFFPGKNIPPEKKIWLHAVSVGEVRGLRTFVDELKKEYDYAIILSVSTTAGFKSAKDIFNDINVINAPLDLSFVIKKFVKVINPKILILNELEVWPNWIRILNKSDIPVVLINGRISDKAYSRYKKFRFLFRPLFKKISRVLIQGEWYRERFRRLGMDDDRITSCGSIKADEAFRRASEIQDKNVIRENLKIDPKKSIFLFASTHLEDENYLFPYIQKISEKYFTVLAPRHIERAKDIAGNLRSAGILTWIYSEKNYSGSGSGVMVFDKMGYLMQLMKISDIVYMGGSMSVSTGGHNLFEAAVLGKVILGGPCYNNFPDIGESLVKKGAYKVVRRGDDIVKITDHLYEKNQKNISKTAITEVDNRRGAVRCILKNIGEYLD